MLESRHLIGIFLGLVVICGVFFTLGYVMGRTQFETTVRAAAPMGKPVETGVPAPRLDPMAPAQKTPAAATPTASEWSFPAATDAKKPADRLEPPPPKTPATASREMKVELNRAPSAAREAAKPAPIAAAPIRNAAHSPAIPKGSIVLQVAALSKEGDALALAEALQRKNFSAFVLRPMGDNLYRVQVGPYRDAAAADAGKKSLMHEGFKAILKR